MRLIFCGDVVGRSGREVIVEKLPSLREKLKADLVIVNGENAAGGFGITPTICKEFYEAGVDIITTGNHIWDQKQILPYLPTDPNCLRPINYSNQSLPGRGVCEFTLKDGRVFVVIHAMCRLFMKDAVDCPFFAVEGILKKYSLSRPSIAGIMIDIHGETNSEKMALAHMVDGQVSFVVGTHTHIPTADAQIFSKGTAYQSDAGMCGDYNSVIGMKPEVPIGRFLGKPGLPRMKPAMGEATLAGVFIEINDRTGLAMQIEPIRVGGILKQTMPEV
ncbi:MAG: TIGR00282 family metallophosphoesterase [Pseudomonadota bacterium]